MKKRLLGFFSIIFVALLLVSCGSTPKVEFDLNGGTSGALEAQEIKKGGLVDKPTDPSREGYTFKYWVEKEENKEWDFEVSKVEKSMTLVAQWDKKIYDVVFDARGGVPSPASQEVEHGAKVLKPADPALEGNTFLGWFEVGAQAAYDFNSEVKGNLNLEAKWELDDYLVTFDANGGLPVPQDQNIPFRGRVEIPTAPTLEGYKFLGWYANNELYNFGLQVRENISLVARWEKLSYSVEFDLNGGTLDIENLEVEHGDKIDEPDVPVLEGHTFLGWFVDDVEFNFEEAVKENLVLVAKWDLNKFDVEFDVDGGEPKPETQTVEYGKKASEPAEPTKEAMLFLGWFVDGDEYNFNDEVKEDIVLKARWETDYQFILDELVDLYEDTFENYDWVAIEDVELVEDVRGVAIVWKSNNEDFFTNEGQVTRPTFSQGNQTIHLEAEVSPAHKHDFFFIVEALEETMEEKLDEILRIVTIVPSSPTGYQETNFDITDKYTIDGEEVPITWETSDATVMTNKGFLVAFEDAAEKEVELTATITYEGVTRERIIVFKVKGVTTYSSFKYALIDENEGEKVRVEGVAFYTYIKANENNPNGYYVASEDNIIAFVYGAKPAMVKEGKLYDVIFEVDIYFGTYQLKNPAYSNERDGEIPVITPVEMTVEDIVNLPKPLTKSFNQTLTTLRNVKVVVEDFSDNYKTFLVDQSLPEGTTLTDQNSIMIYYVSNLEVIQGLNGLRIDEISVINNGYRTNNVVWYVNYIGDGSDIVLNLTDEQAVDAAYNQLESGIPFRVLTEDKLSLITESSSVNIVWESSNVDVIAEDGTVNLGTEGVLVTLTATITAGEEEKVFTRDVWVGKSEHLEDDEIKDILEYDGAFGLMPFKITGVVSGLVSNGTYAIEDDSGAISLRPMEGVTFAVGYEYTIVGTKSIYSGLIQIQQTQQAVKGEEKPLPEAITLTEADLKDNNRLRDLQGHLISIERAEITKYSLDPTYGNVEMTLKVGTATIGFRWDSRVTATGGASVIQGLAVGDFVKLVASPLGWFNNPQIGYDNISQVVQLAPESDEEIVNSAIAGLNLPSIVKADITLPTEGKFEAVIVWSSDNPAVIDNEGKVTLPEGNATVRLTAAVTKGEVTKEVAFYVLVQVDEGVLNVRLARKEASEAEVKFEGIVSGFGGDRYVYISDADGMTIPLFQPVVPEGLKLGDFVEVEGKIKHYNGLIQIDFGGEIEIKESGHAVPDAIELDKIPTFSVDDQGRRYNLDNLIVKSVKDRSMVVTDGIEEVTVYVDPDNAEVVAHIASAENKKVDLVGIHLGWFNKAQFLVHEKANVVIKELTDLEKAHAELKAIVLPEKITTDDKLELPTEGAIHEQAIVWSSNHVDVIAADGTVVLPEEAITVTLTATITVGEEDVIYNFSILVDPTAAEEHTATLKYSGASGNLGGANEASTLNLDPSLFDVRAIQGSPGFNIGVNVAGQVRLYSVRASGEGNTLKVSIAEGSTIVGLKFVFAKAGNPANSGLLTLGTEEVNLTEADLQTTKVFEDLEISEFTLFNNHLGGDKNGQIWIVELVITYIGEAGEQPVDPDPEDPKPEEVMAIADLVALGQDGTGVVQGIITNVGPYNSFSMEDSSGAVAFRIGGKNNDSVDFVVGDMIKASVKVNVFNGLIQAELAGDMEILSSNNTLPALLDLNEKSLAAGDLLQYQSRIVKLDNMEVTEAKIDGYGTVDLTLKRADGETIALRWDNRVPFPGSDTMKDFKVGDVVNISGATIGWFNNPQLSVDGPGQIVLA